MEAVCSRRIETLENQLKTFPNFQEVCELDSIINNYCYEEAVEEWEKELKQMENYKKILEIYYKLCHYKNIANSY